MLFYRSTTATTAHTSAKSASVLGVAHLLVHLTLSESSFLLRNFWFVNMRLRVAG
jgi:hypothetical protein